MRGHAGSRRRAKSGFRLCIQWSNTVWPRSNCASVVPYVLQDGNILTVVAKHFRGAEVLLQPSSAAEETIGFFDKSFQTVMKDDV